MKVSCRNAEVRLDLEIERGEYGQRRIRTRSRPCADALAPLTMKHEHHSVLNSGVVAKTVQNGGGGAERKIADDFETRLIDDCGKIEIQKVRVDDLDATIARENSLEPLC